jgi:hypothetical protein
MEKSRRRRIINQRAGFHDHSSRCISVLVYSSFLYEFPVMTSAKHRVHYDQNSDCLSA